jgi:hypothetical protein
MKPNFKIIFADKVILSMFYATVSCMLLYFLAALFSYSHLPPLVPLFNQQPWGEQRLGIKLEIFEPLLFCFFVFCGNFYFASHMYTKMPLIGRMLSIASFVVAMLSLLFIVRTIQLMI